MTDAPRRKRSLRKMVLGVFIVAFALVVIAVMRVNDFLRRRVRIESLKFPVLVLQPNDLLPFAEWDSPQLKLFTNSSVRSPVNGTYLIDSDFNLCIQENVVRKENEIGWLARRYLTPNLRVRYTFDLKRARPSDQATAMQLLLARQRYSDDPAENAAMHAAVAKQTTMAGILDALKLYKPIEVVPTTAPALTTEPAEMIDAGPEAEKLPGEPH